jgi:hypothetical protein
LLEANAADPRRHSSTVGDKTFAEEASSGISSSMLSPVASSDAAHLNVSLSFDVSRRIVCNYQDVKEEIFLQCK